MKGIGRPFLVILLILIFTVGGFIYYYLQASAEISIANSTAFTLNQQVSNLQSQLSSANSRISTAQNQLASANSSLSSMQSQLSSANSQIASLQSDISSYKSQVSSLQGDTASYKSQIASLQSDLASYKSQIASLQSQFASSSAADVPALQAQVSSLLSQNKDLMDIVHLAKVSTKADQVSVNQPASHSLSMATFTADFAGYITVAGQTSSPDIYITVTDSFPGYPYSDYRYPFGTGTKLTIPVLPGTVTVYYNNANPNAISTGTISVRYYY